MLTPTEMRRLSLRERVETDKSQVTVEEIDRVLKDLSKEHGVRDLVNFWLDVRLDLSKGGEK